MPEHRTLRMQDPDDRFHRLLYLIILAQFFAIIVLFSGLSSEYLSNAYMQAWIQNNAPMLGVLLHGELDTALIGIAIGLTVLLIQRNLPPSKKATMPTVSESQMPGFKPTHALLTKTIADDPALDPPSNFKKKQSVKELPEHVLAELEKTDV